MLTVRINNRPIEIEKGMTIFQAAEKLGISIPSFGGDDNDICFCEIEGEKELVMAYETIDHDDTVIWTESHAVKQARVDLISDILKTHPQDCMNCGKLGECKLQKYSQIYNVTAPEVLEEYKHIERDSSGYFYVREPDKCIRCGACIKVCRDKVGVDVLEKVSEDGKEYILIKDGKTVEESPCVSCGNCVSVCPVGALLPKSQQRFREWETRKVRTTCSYCGVGCQIEYSVRGNKIVAAKPADGPSNHGLLCVKGKFAFDFVNHRDRLTQPLIRKNGKFVPASWEEALDLVASKIIEIRNEHGADAIAGFSSARTVNEDNYLFQKFMRAAVGTNNVDHCARLCHSSTVAGLATTLGSGAMTNSIPEIKDADVIFITGSNTTETHPVMGMYVRQAHNAGKKIIVADPVRIPLAEIADIYLQINPGSSVALSNGMLHVIFEEGLEDREYIEKYTEGIEELREAVKKYTPEAVAEICGVDKELIIEAARLYASTHKSYIAYAMGITQHVNGTDNVSSLSNLALVTGNIGKEASGVNPLRGQNNVQGACDMGALPTDYPGYQKVVNNEVREKFQRAWNVRLSSDPGYTVTQTIPAILDDRVKLLYVMGENPMVSDPDTRHVEKALEKVFLVAQDIFLTETCEYADVVFPATAFAEKEGTFTNTERRVQKLRQVVPPKGECRDDWWILMQVMNRIGYPCRYESVEDVFNEMRTVTPSYAGMTYDRIEKEGLVWPCQTEDHPGTPILHMNGPLRSGGKGLLKPLEWRPSPDVQDPEFPMVLTSCRILYHYHTRTMTDKTHAIHSKTPRNWIEIYPEDAAAMDIHEGEWVKVSSARGHIYVEARISDSLQPGVAWMPFHYSNGANVLTDAEHLDPVSKIPGFKQIGIKIEKVPIDKAQQLAKDAMEKDAAYYENEEIEIPH